MKILHLHNRYRTKYGGEYVAIDNAIRTAESADYEVVLETRDSSSLTSLFDKFCVFFSSSYSLRERSRVARLIAQENPDIVHVHNLYPQFSPSVLDSCRQGAVPVVMSVHNFGLTCPISLHFRKETMCIRCLGRKQHWCALLNCADSLPKSLNYAARSAIADALNLFRHRVDAFVVPTDFMKNWLAGAGFDETKIFVIPHGVEIPAEPATGSRDKSVLFAGRLEKTKGIRLFLEAADANLDIPFRVVGDGPLEEEARARPRRNVTFAGRVDQRGMAAEYGRSLILVFPSIGFEAFGLVVAEAMSHSVPVIASRIGGISELVDEGVSGLLFDPSDASELSNQIARLWHDPDLCSSMGAAARRRAETLFSQDRYAGRLLSVYESLARR